MFQLWKAQTKSSCYKPFTHAFTALITLATEPWMIPMQKNICVYGVLQQALRNALHQTLQEYLFNACNIVTLKRYFFVVCDKGQKETVLPKHNNRHVQCIKYTTKEWRWDATSNFMVQFQKTNRFTCSFHYYHVYQGFGQALSLSKLMTQPALYCPLINWSKVT